MTLCEEGKRISKEVSGFIGNVSEVKEESITDYLMWKWRELNSRLNFIDVSAFTKEEENKRTGADFELELWLVQRGQAVPLLIQAKKFIKDHDGYCGKLNYEAHNGRQIDLLLDYASKRSLLPFYLIYSQADANTNVLCGGGAIDPQRDQTGLFIASAFDIKKIADGCRNKKTSKNAILSVANPFSCFFCCPMIMMGGLRKYIGGYFPSVREIRNATEFNDENVPQYVRMLLSGELPSRERMYGLIRENELQRLSKVAVFDMRDVET